MRSLLAVSAAIALASASLACSSSGSPDSGDHSQHASDAATDDTDAATSDAGSDSASSAATLKAPTITMVMKMTGGLHVMWTNNQTDCDAIEGERKSTSEAYKVVFTIADGSVDNKHDAPLTSGTAYTYRLRCKKGADYSSYSNEKSGTP